MNTKFNLVCQFESENRGIYDEYGNLLMPFKSKEQLSQHHDLYIYVYTKDDGKLVAKFGKCDESILTRYKSQKIIGEANACVWTAISSIGDEIGHKKLRQLSDIHKEYRWISGEEANNTDENYEMTNGISSLIRFIQDIEKIYNTTNIRENVPLYEDILKSAIGIFETNKQWNILYFCPRAGKTRTNLSLTIMNNMAGHRISIMFSYVGTVRNSYKHDIDTIEQYKNFRFIDLNDINNVDETFEEINNFLNNSEDNHVMLYFALTGDERVFNKRKEILYKLNKYSKIVFVEEADYGAHCDNKEFEDSLQSKLNRVNEIVSKCKVKHIYITTGTGHDKIMNFVKNKNYAEFTKDYFIDILNS